MARIEGDRNFAGLARDRIDHKTGVAATMIEEPDQHHIVPICVASCHGSSVIANRRRHTVVPVAVA